MSRLNKLRKETASKRYENIDCRYTDRYNCHPVPRKAGTPCLNCIYDTNNFAKLYSKLCEVPFE